MEIQRIIRVAAKLKRIASTALISSLGQCDSNSYAHQDDGLRPRFAIRDAGMTTRDRNKDDRRTKDCYSKVSVAIVWEDIVLHLIASASKLNL